MKIISNFISPIISEWAFVLLVSCISLYNAQLFGVNAFHIIPLPFVCYFFLNYPKHGSFQRDYITLFMLLMLQVLFFTLASENVDIIGNMKTYILSLMVMTYKPNIKMANTLLTVLAISGLILGFYTLQNPEYIAGSRLTVKIGDVIQDPTWITVLLLPPFCVGICMLNDKSTLKKLLAFFMILFPLYMVFLSGSRGSLLAMLIAFITWAVRSTNRGNRIKLFFAIILISIVGYYFYMSILGSLNDGLIERYTGEDDESGHIRLYTWGLIINGWLDSNILQFLFGHGLGSCIRDFRLDAHNMLLQQVYEMGILGFALMVAFLFKITKHIYASKDTCCICMINALVIVTLLTPIWGHIYYFILLACIMYIVYTKRIFHLKSNRLQ